MDLTGVICLEQYCILYRITSKLNALYRIRFLARNRVLHCAVLGVRRIEPSVPRRFWKSNAIVCNIKDCEQSLHETAYAYMNAQASADSPIMIVVYIRIDEAYLRPQSNLHFHHGCHDQSSRILQVHLHASRSTHRKGAQYPLQAHHR